MICESCRARPATIHRLTGDEGARWLCERCAGLASAGGLPPTDDHAAADAFLVDDLAGGGDAACPECGWTLARFRNTQRLGCGTCYRTFRSQLMPLLGRLHRHVSHLGRAPLQAGASPGRLASITRTRASLEKAIAAEDFEEAAILRDRIRALEEPEEDAGP